MHPNRRSAPQSRKAKFDRFLIRLILIGSVGILLFLLVARFRISQLPEPAPEELQVSGKQIIRDELERIRESSFGRSPRGTILCDRVENFLEEGRIIFSSKLGGPRGMWHQSIFGKEKIYVRILEMNNARFIHQLPYQMMEAIVHEAVHSAHGRFHRNSIEEECDAFVAGMTVEALIKGDDVPNVFIIDGKTLGSYLLAAYSDLRRNPDCRPIGISLEEIYRRSGLEGP